MADDRHHQSKPAATSAPRRLEWPGRLELAEQSRSDGLWRAYVETHVLVNLPAGQVEITPTQVCGALLPPAGDLHIVTACDPGSRGDVRDDAARMALLVNRLSGYSTFTARGVHPASGHGEDSIAVRGLSTEQARELGADFGQVAIFAWQKTTWSVVATCGERRSDLGWTLAESEPAERWLNPQGSTE